MPTGRTPGRLSIATMLHAISVRYVDPGGGYIQSFILTRTALNSSDAHLKQIGQFYSLFTSTNRATEAPKSSDTTHVTSSSVKSRSAILGTSLYSLKEVHVGYSTGGK